MSKRAKVFLLCISVVAVGGVAIWQVSYRGSPEYALNQIREAVEEGNRLKFQNRVALDEFLSSTVDQVVALATANQLSESGETSGWGALGTMLGGAAVEQFKPTLVQTMRTEVLEAVETGRLDSVFSREDSVGEIPLDRFGTVSGLQPERFRGIGAIQEEGDAALVNLRIAQPRLDTVLKLSVRMEKDESLWRVMRPEDVTAYLKDVRSLRETWLANANDSIRSVVRDRVEVGTPSRETTTRLGGITTLKVEVPVANVSAGPLTIVGGRLTTEKDTSVGLSLVAETPQISQGDSTILVGSDIGISSEPIPESLTDTPTDSLTVQVTLIQGQGDSASYIGRYDNWNNYTLRQDSPQAVLAAARNRSESDPLSLDLGSLGEQTSGPWTVSEETNPLDDTKTVALMNEAQSGLTSLGNRPTLILRCRSNETEVYINWDEYLGSDRPVVTYRIGEASEQQRRWNPSTDDDATFYPGNHIALIKQLMKVDRFVARVQPYDESPVTAVFKMGNLQEQITPLREACHW